MNSASEDCVISYKLKENESSSSQIDKIGNEKVHCALSADLDSVRNKHESFSDELLWLKTVAIDHYRANSSRNSQRLCSQILKARKLLFLSHDEAPWRKRKLNQLLHETVTTASDMPLEKPNGRTSTKRGKCSIASSFSCSINSADSKGSSDQIQNPYCSFRSLKFDNRSQKGIPNCHSFQPDALERCSASDTEVLLALDADDSVSDSNLSCSTKPLNQSPQQRPIKFLKSGNNDPRKPVRICPYKGYSNKASIHDTPQKSASLFDFIGDYFPRMAIPVGPRFQAEIPELAGVPNRDSFADGDANPDDSEKWLGNRIWPIEGVYADSSMEVIGKGRPFSCSCNSPGSTHCIKLHVNQRRLQLQSDLSSAFLSWKFDEMGEAVSQSWTPKDQESFRILVKTNPVSKNMSFWKPALKFYPSKPRESLASYYFNVFVLRRMSRQTRLGSTVIDSDDDEADEGVFGQSNDVKQRYLIGLR